MQSSVIFLSIQSNTRTKNKALLNRQQQVPWIESERLRVAGWFLNEDDITASLIPTIDVTVDAADASTLVTANKGDFGAPAASDPSSWTWEAAAGPGEDDPFAADWAVGSPARAAATSSC